MSESCGECGASFGGAADLVVHARTHLGGGPAAEPAVPASAGTYRCGLCGALFRTPDQLRDHNLLPHGPSPAPRPPWVRRSRPS